MTKGEILEKNNLTVDLVHNKAMTDRVYKAMQEYSDQETERLKAIVSKQEELIKHMGEWFGTGNTTLNRLKSKLEKLKAE